MNALLVAAAPHGSVQLVGELAAGADLVVAVDGGGALCLAAGVTPDLVLGDLDSLPEAARVALESARVPFETLPAEKDETDLEAAIDAARLRGATRLTATAVLGGRIDHTLAALGALARAADLVPRVLEADIALTIAAAGTNVRVIGEGATFSAIGVLGDVVISIDGAQWPLDHRRVETLRGFGVSNVVTGPHARVMVHDGPVAVICPTVGGVRGTLEDDDAR